MRKEIKRIAAILVAGCLLTVLFCASFAEETGEPYVNESNTVTIEAAANSGDATAEPMETAGTRETEETFYQEETPTVTDSEGFVQFIDNGNTEYREIDDGGGTIEPEVIAALVSEVTEELIESSSHVGEEPEEEQPAAVIIVTRAWITDSINGNSMILKANAQPALTGRVTWQIHARNWPENKWEEIGNGERLTLDMSEANDGDMVCFRMEDGTVSEPYEVKVIVREEPTVEEPAAEETAAEDPVAEVSAATEPVDETGPTDAPSTGETARESADEEPAAEEPAEEQNTDEPAGAEPETDEPAAGEPAEEPATEESATEEPEGEGPASEQQSEEGSGEEPFSIEGKTEEIAGEEPISEEPAEEPEAAAEKSAAEEPVTEQPADETVGTEPAAEEHAGMEPSTDEPAEEGNDEEPAVEEPATEEPSEESAGEEPTVEEPAAEEPEADTVTDEKPAGEGKPDETPEIGTGTESFDEEPGEPVTLRAWITGMADAHAGETVTLSANAEPELTGVSTWQVRNEQVEDGKWKRAGYGDHLTVELTEGSEYRFVMQDGTVSEVLRPANAPAEISEEEPEAGETEEGTETTGEATEEEPEVAAEETGAPETNDDAEESEEDEENAAEPENELSEEAGEPEETEEPGEPEEPEGELTEAAEEPEEPGEAEGPEEETTGEPEGEADTPAENGEGEEPGEPEDATEGEEPGEPEEPAADEEDGETGTEEPEEEPEEERSLPEDRSAVVSISWDEEHPGIGSVAHFSAQLSGYEELDYTVQWIVSTDNENWTEVEGATGETMDVVVTEDNYMNYWRIRIHIEGFKDIE